MPGYISLEELLGITLTGSFKTAAGGDTDRWSALDVLLDPGLDNLIRSYGDVFDLVIIANTPLSYSGLTLKSEDNATRFWALGCGDEVPTPKLERLIKAFYRLLVFKVHSSDKSLFLHPWLFDPEHSRDRRAPPVCYCVAEGAHNRVPLPVDRKIAPGTVFSSDYFHTASVLTYQQAGLVKLWNTVKKRLDGKTFQEDLEARLKEQTKLTHDLVSSWFAWIRGREEEGKRATALYATPITTLTMDVPKPATISSGVTGMAWLTVVTKACESREPWDSETRQSARDLLKAMWLYLLSDNVKRRGKASFSLGGQSAIDAATHEMKHVALALRRWIAPTDALFASKSVKREDLDIEGSQVGEVRLALDSALDDKDLAFIVLPDLFRRGLSYIVNWTMSDAPVDLPFFDNDPSKMPRRLEDVATECWQAAFDSLVFAKAYKSSWDIAVIQTVIEAMKGLRSKFPGQPVKMTGDSVGDDDFIWDPSEDREAARYNTWYCRLLIHLFREAIQHGDLVSPIVFDRKVKGNVEKIRVTNTVGDRDVKKSILTSLLKGLEGINFAAGWLGDEFLPPQPSVRVPTDLPPGDRGNQMHGEGVLEFICSRLDATPEKPESASGKFSRVIRIPRPKKR